MQLRSLAQYLIPQHILSRFFGKIANLRIVWLKNFLIKEFIKVYKIDLESAKDPDPTHYVSFNDFFTRELKKEARPIANLTNAVISPVDGKIVEIGTITDNKLIYAKGRGFSLTELLGDQADAKIFQAGDFAVIYLAPYNYHRIHMPCSGVLEKMLYIPGKLFSVNQRTILDIPNVFARNERAITIFNTHFGKMALVMVGALNVGSIETIWHGVITGSKDVGSAQKMRLTSITTPITKGTEIGRFNLGSTVILLTPKNTLQWQAEIKSGSTVQMGQMLGVYSKEISAI